MKWTKFEEMNMLRDGTGKIWPVPEGVTVFRNNHFTVHRTAVGPKLWWLSIKRNDKAPIRDWRMMQRIKNELVGPEAEGVELYPAESRLVDTANQYHMWVLEDTQFPFGFDERIVSEGGSKGSVQRSFDEKPSDLLTAADLDGMVSTREPRVK